MLGKNSQFSHKNNQFWPKNGEFDQISQNITCSKNQFYRYQYSSLSFKGQLAISKDGDQRSKYLDF